MHIYTQEGIEDLLVLYQYCEQYDQGLQCYINKRDDFICTTLGNCQRANDINHNRCTNDRQAMEIQQFYHKLHDVQYTDVSDVKISDFYCQLHATPYRENILHSTLPVFGSNCSHFLLVKLHVLLLEICSDFWNSLQSTLYVHYIYKTEPQFKQLFTNKLF